MKFLLNGEQNIIFVETRDSAGEGNIAFGDQGRFDKAATVPFAADQFPLDILICFSTDKASSEFSFAIDDSQKLDLAQVISEENEEAPSQK